MLKGIKRWLSRAPTSLQAAVHPAAQDLEAWAAARDFTYRGVQSEGFLIDGRLEATAWRLEWGPSQRPYVKGQELRLRAELGLPPDLQLVVLNRSLQEEVESAVYAQYVEGVQTRIDNQTPPEMRWLVMYPALPAAEMGALHPAWVAMSSQPSWLRRWLAGPMGPALSALTPGPEAPVVLIIGRGRLMLRTAQAHASAADVQAWVSLFETAMREARRVALTSPDNLVPSTTAAQWEPPPPTQPPRKPLA